MHDFRICTVLVLVLIRECVVDGALWSVGHFHPMMECGIEDFGNGYCGECGLCEKVLEDSVLLPENIKEVNWPVIGFTESVCIREVP